MPAPGMGIAGRLIIGSAPLTRVTVSQATPWLPLPAAHLARSVARQEADPASSLNGFRRFLRWRRRQYRLGPRRLATHRQRQGGYCDPN